MAMSTTEYIAASDATKEAIWLKRLLELVGAANKGPIPMNVDNQGIIKLIKNSEFHRTTKHIEVHFHFIREKYKDGEIAVKYVSYHPIA